MIQFVILVFVIISEALVRRCSVKKRVLKNSTKFIEKYLCQSLSFIKVASLRPATLLKKRLWHRCFLVNFVKFLSASFLIEHLRTTASVKTMTKINTKRYLTLPGRCLFNLGLATLLVVGS